MGVQRDVRKSRARTVGRIPGRIPGHARIGHLKWGASGVTHAIRGGFSLASPAVTCIRGWLVVLLKAR